MLYKNPENVLKKGIYSFKLQITKPTNFTKNSHINNEHLNTWTLLFNAIK